MRQLSIWSSATESRTSLRSSSFCFREWTSWSLVRRRRSAKALNASQGSAEFADSTDFSHIQSLVPITQLLVIVGRRLPDCPGRERNHVDRSDVPLIINVHRAHNFQ